MTRTDPSESKWRADLYAQLQSILTGTTLDVRLAFSPESRTMLRYNPRQDEYDVDFEDTRQLAVLRWEEMVTAACESLSSPVDRQLVQEPRDSMAVADDIKEKASDQTCTASMRRTLMTIVSLPKSLSNLTSSFIEVLAPHNIEFNILWGLLFLNIKVSVRTDSSLRCLGSGLTAQSYRWNRRKSYRGPLTGSKSCGGLLSGSIIVTRCATRSPNPLLPWLTFLTIPLTWCVIQRDTFGVPQEVSLITVFERSHC